MLRLILNILWLIIGGGFVSGLIWLLISLVAFVSIIGIPWGRACFNIALFTFWPFGREAINREDLYDSEDVGTSPLGTIGNIIWFFLAGIWLAIAHICAAFCYAITIIGIPFAFQHFKLAGMSLVPIGKAIVPYRVAEEAEYRNARHYVDRLRS